MGKLTLEDLINNGWVKGNRYIPRGAKNEYQYNKNNMTITVDCDENDNIIQIFTYSGIRQRLISDMNDLDYYYRNNE